MQSWTRMRSAGRSHRSAFSVRSARFAVRSRISRRQNSNSSAAITGIRPNASGAAGRRGACVQLKKLLEATRPHTASRGARPGSARAARRTSSTAQTPAAPSSAKNSRYGQGPRRAMFERAKPTRPCAEMPAAVDANPPSSTYWAADATVSRARECWPVTCQPLGRAYARDISGSDCAAQIRQHNPRRSGPRCRACPVAARRSRGRCRLPPPSTTFKLTDTVTEINSG